MCTTKLSTMLSSSSSSSSSSMPAFSKMCTSGFCRKSKDIVARTISSNNKSTYSQCQRATCSTTIRLPLVLLIILSILVSKISAIGNFELEILETSNTNSHLLSGYCCGVPLSMKRTRTTGCPPCSTAFRLCLKEYSATEQGTPTVATGCSFGNTTTAVLGGSSFVLSDPVQGAMVLPFTFRWTKSFTLILQALDMYDTSYPDSERLIEETSFSSVILPSPEWKTLDHIGRNARITYRVRVQCAPTYYNTTCTTFCRPRNDQFGHYNCGPQGEKICVNGWMGDNCEKAACKPGCDSIHGKCDKPGECDCRPGWQGPLCSECVVYPGCKHGSCYGEAWKCKCDTNWGGILCDQDLNFCGTHEPCKHGGTCENTAPDRFRCTCADGLSGERCEIIEHPCATQPCKNGGSCTVKESTVRNATIFPVYRTMRGMSSAMGKPVSRRDFPQPSSYLGSSATLGGNKRNTSSSLTSSQSGSSYQEIPTVSNFTCACASGWTGSTCEINIDECAGGPCEHGGTCIDLIGGFRCECPAEWTGDVCQIDTNECELPAAPQQNPNSSNLHTTSTAAIAAAMTVSSASASSALIAALNAASSSLAASVNASSTPTNMMMMMMMGPCVNARQCINLPGSFSCECLAGWGGPTCAKNFDDCVGQCKNGATCMDLVDDYHCACATGFTGRDCETDIDECANSPCRNGGECVDMIGKFNCICPLGYSGTLCEEANDHCTPSPCQVGRCLNTPGSYYCHCPPGRAGKHCEQISPMRNESQCNGKNCSERSTACYPEQCRNGGTCMPESSDHGLQSQCHCAAGWDGIYCTEPINQCRDQPCHNGGTCESGAGWFRCNCAQGFSGPDCRININECSPQPCQGGATCVDGIGGYTCLCPEGRYGLRCEILLSNSKSACSNSSISNSPYSPLNKTQDILTQILIDHSNEDCNACVCENGTSRCTNLWCGPANCFRSNATSKSSNFSGVCKQHEVCVPALTENCLNGPCPLRGDCRTMEPSHRVAPPQLPAKSDCWPNQANLNENCARLSILLDRGKLETGSSVESLCLVFRVLLASSLVKIPRGNNEGMLIIICELKSGTNDTIEVTVSSSPSNDYQPIAVRLLSELLSSRQLRALQHSNASAVEKVKLAALTSILEVKVETAVVTETNNNSILIGILCGILIILVALAIFLGIFCRQRLCMSSATGLHTGPSLDALQYDAEKSNNLQNEEHLRRYTNPLKGSTTSLGRINGIEMSLNPIPEIDSGSSICNASTSSSSVHRSQPLYPDSNFTYDLETTTKTQDSQRKRSSLVLLHKTQNSDKRRSTVDSIESQLKDSGDSLFT